MPRPAARSRPTWKDIPFAGPDFFFGVWGDGAGSVWAVGQAWGGRRGILRSGDWGRTWLAATLNSIYRSTNQGRSWARKYHWPRTDHHAWTYALWLAPDGRAVAAGAHGTLRRRAPAGRLTPPASPAR